MKPRISNQRNRALTFVEVLVVIAALAVLFALLLPSLARVHDGRQGISCKSNLLQIGVAYQVWAWNNNGKYPMQTSVTNGGAMELIVTGNVAACFQVMSNSLVDPKLVICPQDTKRIPATSFSRGFNNDNVSYFVGLDVTNDTNPRMFLSGDDNFAIGGMPVKSGLLELSTNTPIAWTAARHKFACNILFADGSGEQLTTDDLQKALRQTGVATNRLAVP
jgi:prepilin-type processing-associated H-X9-DG protein